MHTVIKSGKVFFPLMRRSRRLQEIIDTMPVWSPCRGPKLLDIHSVGRIPSKGRGKKCHHN